MNTKSVIQSAAVLLASSSAALAIIPVGTVNVTFSDLPTVTAPVYGQQASIPDGYAGLDWGNFDYRPGKSHGLGPGFINGTVYSPNVAFNASTLPSTITSVGNPFDLLSVWLTSGYVNGLEVEIKAFKSGQSIFDETYTLTTRPQDIQFNGAIDGADELEFISLGVPSNLPVVHPLLAQPLDGSPSSPNGQFVVGGLTFTPTPNPISTPDGGSTMLLLGAVFGGMAWLRRKLS